MDSKTAALALLGLTTTATTQDIKTAYRKLVLQWHPDKHVHDRESATQVFVNIVEAYRILLDDFDEQDLNDPSRVTLRPHRPPTPFFAPHDVSFESEDEEVGQFDEVYSSSGDGSEPRTPPASEPSSPFFYSPYLPLSPLPEDVLPDPCLQSFPDVGLDTNLGVDPGPVPPYQTPPMVYRVPEDVMTRAYTYPTFEKAYTSHHVTFPSSAWPPRAASFTQGRSSTSQETAGSRRQPTRPSSDPYSDHWICTLQLSLLELSMGKKCHFELYRHATKRRKRTAVVDFVVQPGTTDGTSFFCRGMGNERPDGTYQDVLFVVEELPHHDFARVGNDLVLDMFIPPGSLDHDSQRYHLKRGRHKLRKQATDDLHDPDARHDNYVKVKGLRDEEYLIETGCLLRNSTEDKVGHVRRGVHIIVGAGMPLRKAHGRPQTNLECGNLIVRWECPIYAPSRWRLFKDLFHDVVAL